MKDAPIRCCGCGLPIVDCKPELHRVNEGELNGPGWLCHPCRYAYMSPRLDEAAVAVETRDFLARQDLAYGIPRRYLQFDVVGDLSSV